MHFRTAWRLASWGLLAALAWGGWSAGPAKAADSGAAEIPAIIDRGAATPKALLESIATLMEKKAPPQDWLGLQPPANKELAKTQLELQTRLGARAKSVAALVESKIGKMEAGMIASMQGGVQVGWQLTLINQMDALKSEGKVDWDKAKIVENGDKAKAGGPGMQATIFMEKVNGKWYLSASEGIDTLPKDIPLLKETTAKSLKILDVVEQKVNSGAITKRNFIQEYQKIVNDTMAPDQK
jgi:hypothetical protein